MRFIIHDNEGKILQFMSGPLPDVEAACNYHGLKFLETSENIAEEDHYVENGQVKPKPPPPSPHHQFDYTTKQWADPRTLDDLKVQKWNEMKTQRDAVEFGGFVWNGYTFDSDQLSQQRIQGAAQMAQIAASQGQPYSITWTLADNSGLVLTGDEMISVGMQMGFHIDSCHARGRELREQINSASTREEVEAIAW